MGELDHVRIASPAGELERAVCDLEATLDERLTRLDDKAVQVTPNIEYNDLDSWPPEKLPVRESEAAVGGIGVGALSSTLYPHNIEQESGHIPLATPASA